MARPSWLVRIASCCFVFAFALEAGANTLTDQFREPGVDYAPKVRWWWPGSAVEVNELGREIDEMKAAGFAGAEVSFLAPEGLDLATFGWDQDSWPKALGAALGEAKARGFKLDLTLGPSWPLSVAGFNSVDDPKVEQELVSGFARTTKRGGRSCFDGPVPQPETPAHKLKLIAATAAVRTGLRPATGPTSTQTILLNQRSLVDLTARVDGRGTLHWCADATETPDRDWIVFGFWQTPTGQLVGKAASSSPMYVMDHFSRAATDALTRDWDQRLLTPAAKAGTGGDFFGDSLEISAQQLWTEGFVDRFRKTRGYDLRRYLPLIHIANIHDVLAGAMGRPRGPNEAPDFDVESPLTGLRVREDYYRTLSEMMEQNHLQRLKEWANRGGRRLRYQPAYGTTLNLISNAKWVDVPETESLHSGNQIDYHRAMASAAHVLGQPVVSSECCADMFGDYGQTLKDVLAQIDLNFIGGVNQIVYHGRPYKYEGAGVEWPGWQPFSPSFPVDFSEAFDSRQPYWASVGDLNGYVRRTQFALRQGEPRIDVAIYRESFWWPSKRYFFEKTAAPLYEGGELVQGGYTYDFLDPSLLGFLNSDVLEDRTIGFGRPRYKAILFDNQKTLSLESARRFERLVNQGLKLVFIGDLPEMVPGFAHAKNGDRELAWIMATLTRMNGVVRVGSRQEVPAALKRMGITPDFEPVGIRQNSVASVHRSLADGGDLYFISAASEVGPGSRYRLTSGLKAGAHVYTLDGWSGRTREMTFRQEANAVEIEFNLRVGQTKLVYIGGSDPSAEKVTRAKVGETVRLDHWTLFVNQYKQGDKGPGKIVPLARLVSWSAIPSLQDVSGIGRYETTIDLKSKVSTARLHVGRVEGAYRIWINGMSVGPVDPFSDTVEIGPQLRNGSNKVTIEVETTLRNELLTTWQADWSSQIKALLLQIGAPIPDDPPYTRQDYGLIGPVSVEY